MYFSFWLYLPLYQDAASRMKTGQNTVRLLSIIPLPSLLQSLRNGYRQQKMACILPTAILPTEVSLQKACPDLFHSKVHHLPGTMEGQTRRSTCTIMQSTVISEIPTE